MIEAGPLLSHWSRARKRDRGVPDLIDGLIFDADQLRQALTATWSEGCYSLKAQSEGPYPAQ